jgi:DNA-binding NarL/FixJ family response regulator
MDPLKGVSSESAFLGRFVWIIDGDPRAREVLAAFFRVSGAGIATGTSLSDMRALSGPLPDILLINLALGPDDDVTAAIEQTKLGRADSPLIVAVANELDVDLIVAAVKAGADHVIAKPIDTGRLANYVSARLAAVPRTVSHPRLTPRESDVLSLVTRGYLNREVAAELRISLRTVETHRLRLMKKLGARNAVDLVKIVLAEVHGTGKPVSAPGRGADRAGAVLPQKAESP